MKKISQGGQEVIYTQGNIKDRLIDDHLVSSNFSKESLTTW